MIMSPSMSLVAAGVASGICFILLSSIRKGKTVDTKRKTKEIQVDDSRCACCLKPFLIERGVRCNDCGVRSCRKGCSRWDTSENAWHCLFCHQRRSWLRRNEKWFETFGGVIDEEELHRYFSTAKSRVYVAGVENAAASSTLGLAAEGQEETNTMETVRDFVEKIVEGLIGNVDDTPIDRIYDHPDYKPSTDSPTMAHTALREIVERAVEEARKLPGLGGSGGSGRTQEGRNIAEHSYEDLLATAILNKVIEKFQREQVDGNSNVLHGKTKSTTKCTLSESELGLDEGVEEGSSSLEPLSQDECSSDCSASRSRHIRHQSEPLSLTIEERIEEVTTTYTSDEDRRDSDVLGIRNARRVPFPELGMDIIDPSQESSEDSQDESDAPTTHVDLVSPIESWEENWLFQKKRVQAQPDPVAMLVPNSSADYKALIGDKDAEDTSDLSECSSAQSDEEVEKELMEAINNVVPRSPRLSESEYESNAERNARAANGRESRLTESKAVVVEKLKNGEDGTSVDLHGSKEGIIKGKKDWKGSSRDQSEEGSSGLKEGPEKCEIRDKRETKAERDGENVNAENKTKDAKPLRREISEKPSVPTTGLDVETLGETANVGNQGSAPLNSAADTLKSLENGEDARSAAESKDSLTEIGTPDSLEYSKSIGASSNARESLNNSFPDENVDGELPKTPTPTPTRNSVTESSYGEADVQEVYVASSEIVLNSLEYAKKKLMGVDDDVEGEEVKESNAGVYKLDFHAEDEAQQESEYTEHYDIATQRHLDSLTKVEQNPTAEADIVSGDVKQVGRPRTSDSENSRCREAVAFAEAESVSRRTPPRKTESEDRLATPPRPGTIAEREHKKWENAPPIENNPYSEESIQRRLWERQYSRRSADIPGVHTELPKSNGADLETVLEHNQPDITRFGRDYYINNSKLAGGERTRRSTTSASSRPSSSLSQLSSSTGADHEQQVSFELERFEEASLRGSLSRWRYRDPRASPHFAINPLLRLDDASDESRLVGHREATSEETLDSSKRSSRAEKREEGDEEASSESWRPECVEIERRLQRNEATNPLYDCREENPTNPVDRDSGRYSMRSNEVGSSKWNNKNREEDWERLSWMDVGDRHAKENQILSANGRRYWNTGGCRYQTFGGIKTPSHDSAADDPEEDYSPALPSGDPLSFGAAEFADFEFQTFGGIKRGRKVDGRRIPSYRKIRLRPLWESVKKVKVSSRLGDESIFYRGKENISSTEGCPSDGGVINQNESSTAAPFEEDDWEDEEGECAKEVPTTLSRKGNKKLVRSRDWRSRRSALNSKGNDTLFNGSKSSDCKGSSKRPSEAMSSSSCRSSATNDWQYRSHENSDILMTKFLMDASRRSKSSRVSTDDSTYSLNTAKRRILALRGDAKKLRTRKPQSSSVECDSLKLEPPIVPEIVERKFESLREIRDSADRRNGIQTRAARKLGVRSLSDVTIW